MNEVFKIHCSVCTGFEKVAIEEAKEVLNASIIKPYMDKDTRGRIVIEVEASKIHLLKELRTVDSLYIITNEYLDVEIPHDKEDALEFLHSFVPMFNWKIGIDVWQKYFTFEHPISCIPTEISQTTSTAGDSESVHNALEDKDTEIPSKNEVTFNPLLPKFRCTCYRTGDGHPFSSMDVAASVGGRIQDYFGWNVDLKNHDIEVVLFVEDNRIRVCIALTRGSLHIRNLRHFGPTALRATVSASLYRYAGGAKAGQIVCDPMCGSGSIPMEAAQVTPHALHLCGDNHEKARERVMRNLEDFSIDTGRNLPINVIHWDVTKLPLRSSCVDLFIVDLPFGKRSGNKFDNRRLYPAALKEMARVGVPQTGRACLLTQDRRSILQAINQTKQFWKLNKQASVNIGGLLGGIYLLTRTIGIP